MIKTNIEFKRINLDASSKTIFAPSSTHIWRHCKGSVLLESPVNDFVKRAGEKGKRLHGYAENLLIGKDVDKTKELLRLEKQEDRELIIEYVSKLSKVKKEVIKNKTYFIGFEVPLEGMFSNWYVRGYADFISYDGKTLFVADLKSGNTPLEEEHFAQLLLYALMFLEHTDIKPKKVMLKFFSKRTSLFNEYTFKDLLIFKNKITKSLADPSYEFKVGNHCKKCFKLKDCGKVDKYVDKAIRKRKELSIKALIKFEGIFKKKMDALKVGILEKYQKEGELPDGVFVKKGNKTKFWRDEKTLIRRHGEKAYDKKLITPAQAIKKKLKVDDLIGIKEPVLSLTTDGNHKNIVAKKSFKELYNEKNAE